jgi:2-dehydropantoate 2-reductase
MAVARALDVEIIADDPVDDVINRDLGPAGHDKKSSILEDVENERPTEIRHINGAVVELGEEVGVDTPYNRFATQFMAGKERGYLD